ncbi:MAG TPA: (2Fe-2S)-binding protein [Gemmatimonadaceae bacterium]|nr:(2Fe-2S)-binding protein [Gemmatimonadaceae bacterium]
MPVFVLTINRRRHTVDADPTMPLLWLVRDRLELFGTKFGCGTGVCGACTILEDDRAVRSCTIPVASAAGKSYTTIEGLSPDGGHPCQRAWLDEDVAQCGFCQPGMIMEAVALLRAKPRPTDRDIDGALATHVCRCGTYVRIRRAVQRAAEHSAR